MHPECQFCEKFPKKRFLMQGPKVEFDVCKDHYSLGVDLEAEFIDKLNKVYREFNKRVIAINKEK